MTKTDARGLTVSTTSGGALELFETALRRLQCYLGDPVEAIDQALDVDPDFVMGHIFRAEVHMTLWEGSVLPEIETSLRALDGLIDKANERERAHVGAIKAWASGDWEGARARLDMIAAAWPRDALAIQVGHLSAFYHGDRDNLRGIVQRAIPHWRTSDPGYGFLLGMLAFGLEECGDYGRAEETGRRALAMEPEDCWAQHAIAHVMEMQSRQEEGIAFMEERREFWAQPDNGFQFHNWWHTALSNLDLDRTERVFEIYDQAIRAEAGEIQLEMLDAAALLWRLRLRGLDVGPRWQELAACYAKTNDGGFYAFNDMHAMMAYVAAGRHGDAARLLTTVQDQVAAATTNGTMTRAVGLVVVQAIEAFGREAYDETVDLLMSVRYRAHVFGGSHAQRDIVHRTLIEAALRAQKGALAEALTNERQAQKPNCPFSLALGERAQRLREATTGSCRPASVAA